MDDILADQTADGRFSSLLLAIFAGLGVALAVAGLLGIALGLLGARALGQVAARFLYGVSPADPLTFAGSAALLALIVLAATLIPCRRAARLDPLEALRSD